MKCSARLRTGSITWRTGDPDGDPEEGPVKNRETGGGVKPARQEPYGWAAAAYERGSGMSERYEGLPEEELPQESGELALVSVDDFYDLLMEQQEQM